MTEAEILSAVRAFIEENFLYMKPRQVLGDDDNLMKNGIVDSMGVLEVLSFLEEKLGVTVADDDVTEANLGTFRAIARFVAAKRVGVQGT